MKEKEKKPRTKVAITLDTELYEQLEQIIVEKYIDRSLLFDGLLREWLKNNTENDGNK